MIRNLKRVFAHVMTAAICIGLLAGADGLSAKAAAKEFYFNAAEDIVISTVEGGTNIVAGKYGSDKSFTFTAGITKATGKNGAVELSAKSDETISFQVKGYGNVILRASSSGDDAESVVALTNASGVPVAPAGESKGEVKIEGSTPTTIVYTNLVEGTYYIKNFGENSGVRVSSIFVSTGTKLDDIAGSYILNPGTENKISKLNTDDKVEPGKYGPSEFFTFTDQIEASSSYYTKRANTAQPSLEIAKKDGSAISFTVAAGANVTLLVSSTGSKNSSNISLVDANNAKIDSSNGLGSLITVEGSEITVITYTNLKAGTYSIVAPSDGEFSAKRGVRLYLVSVLQPGKAGAEPTPMPTATPVPTATPEATPTPTEAPQATPEVTPTESADVTPTEAVDATPSPTPAPTATTAPTPTVTSVPTVDPLAPEEPASTVPIKDILFIVGFVALIAVIGVAVVIVVMKVDKKTKAEKRKQYKD